MDEVGESLQAEASEDPKEVGLMEKGGKFQLVTATPTQFRSRTPTPPTSDVESEGEETSLIAAVLIEPEKSNEALSEKDKEIVLGDKEATNVTGKLLFADGRSATDFVMPPSGTTSIIEANNSHGVGVDTLPSVNKIDNSENSHLNLEHKSLEGLIANDGISTYDSNLKSIHMDDSQSKALSPASLANGQVVMESRKTPSRMLTFDPAQTSSSKHVTISKTDTKDPVRKTGCVFKSQLKSDEEREKMNEAAYDAWLTKKDMEVLNRRREISSKSSTIENKKERCEQAYQAWLEGKAKEARINKAKDSVKSDTNSSKGIKDSNHAAVQMWLVKKSNQVRRESKLMAEKMKEEEQKKKRHASLRKEGYQRYVLFFIKFYPISWHHFIYPDGYRKKKIRKKMTFLRNCSTDICTSAKRSS